MFHSNRERQLRSEIEAHIAAETELNIERGMSPEEARSAALRRFGNLTQTVEEARSVWIPGLVDEFAQNFRYAVRAFRRSPAFALSAAAIIALSMGAVVPVFSFLDRVFLRPLPYEHGGQLVTLGLRAPILDFDFLFANDYLYLRQSKTPFSNLTSWTGVPECDLTEESPLSLACGQVESTFLPTLGIKPLLGRNLTPDEDRAGAMKVALLSFGFWKSRFAGDSRVLGRSISIDGNSVQIIGVLPRSFEFPSLARIDLLIPQAMAISAYRPNQSGRALHVIARLKPGVSVNQAFEQLQPFFRFQLASVPPNFREEVRPALQPLRQYQVGSLLQAGWLLAASLVAILLIEVANLASLLLARGLSRAREFDIRFSLGAGRWRLARQIITESVVLNLFGAAIGYLVAAFLIRVLRAFAPATIQHAAEVTLDLRVLLFTCAASLVTGVIVGLIAALTLPERRSLSGKFASKPSGQTRLRHGLVAIQIAVSLTLVSVSGLLIESFQRLYHLSYGLQSEHVLVADISLGFKRYPNSAARQQFLETLLERLRPIPGTSAVAFTDTVPPSGFVHDRPFSNFVVNGHPVETRGTGGMVAWRTITPQYFHALGIPILRGGSFEGTDRPASEDVIVLSKTLAHRLFDDAEAVGSRIRVAPGNPDYRVVGVVADVRNSGSSAAQLPEYYVLRKKIVNPQEGRDANIMSRSVHFYDGQGSVIVRTAGREDLVTDAIRQEIHELDPVTPVAVSTLDSRIAELRQAPRLRMLLVSIFAILALFLAATGLYGAMSYLVTARTREIGVRMAVGATPPQVMRLVLQQALLWTLAGLVPGLLLSFAAARFFRPLLFQVAPYNPKLFAFAASVLLLVTTLASLLPSIRASRVDPVNALRHD